MTTTAPPTASRFTSDEVGTLLEAIDALDALWDLDAERGLRDCRDGAEYARVSAAPRLRAMLNAADSEGVPDVPARLDGAHWIIVCPYCGDEHRHGNGTGGDPRSDVDVADYLGHRAAHCSAPGSEAGYRLVRP